MNDLIIQNGKIVDGTGKPAFVGDIAIKDGKIVHKKEAMDNIYRLYSQDNIFIGLAEGDANGNLKVKRLMAI